MQQGRQCWKKQGSQRAQSTKESMQQARRGGTQKSGRRGAGSPAAQDATAAPGPEAPSLPRITCCSLLPCRHCSFRRSSAGGGEQNAHGGCWLLLTPVGATGSRPTACARARSASPKSRHPQAPSHLLAEAEGHVAVLDHVHDLPLHGDKEEDEPAARHGGGPSRVTGGRQAGAGVGWVRGDAGLLCQAGIVMPVQAWAGLTSRAPGWARRRGHQTWERRWPQTQTSPPSCCSTCKRADDRPAPGTPVAESVSPLAAQARCNKAPWQDSSAVLRNAGGAGWLGWSRGGPAAHQNLNSGRRRTKGRNSSSDLLGSVGPSSSGFT